MPVEEWTNVGTELNLRAVLGKELNLPLHLEGDFTANTFTGQWRTLDSTNIQDFAVQPPQFPVTPTGETGDWTLVLVKYGTTSPEQPDAIGELYRYDVEMDGSPLLHGRLVVVGDA